MFIDFTSVACFEQTFARQSKTTASTFFLPFFSPAVYSFVVVGAQKTNDLMCYNCSHSYAQGVDVGEMNCKDPFANNGIKKIKCNGLCVVS